MPDPKKDHDDPLLPLTSLQSSTALALLQLILNIEAVTFGVVLSFIVLIVFLAQDLATTSRFMQVSLIVALFVVSAFLMLSVRYTVRQLSLRLAQAVSDESRPPWRWNLKLYIIGIPLLMAALLGALSVLL